MITIIKYNAGNITSVKNALERLGAPNIITDNPKEILAADKVIFPGVGEANSTMQYLRERKLDVLIKNLRQPVLGICLGLQLMCQYSEENDTECLGIFDTVVRKFPPKDKVPHIGWNDFVFGDILPLPPLKGEARKNIFQNLPKNPNVYFVHSYAAEICKNTTAICDYILPFSAAVQKDNFYATQFHPEKSGSVGEQILTNFLNL